jgi:hypothetical protein
VTVFSLSELSSRRLASAYQLQQHQVEEDSERVHDWSGSNAELLIFMQQRHGWTPASEYARYYVDAIRRALLPIGRNGSH